MSGKCVFRFAFRFVFLLCLVPALTAVLTDLITYMYHGISFQIPLHYCTVYFEMRLLNGDDGYRGHHNMLRLLSHCSRPVSVGPTGNIQQQHQQQHHEKVEYSLPRRTDFRFHRFYNSINLSAF